MMFFDPLEKKIVIAFYLPPLVTSPVAEGESSLLNAFRRKVIRDWLVDKEFDSEPKWLFSISRSRVEMKMDFEYFSQRKT